LVTSAVACGNLTALRSLLSRGASPSQPDAFGDTALSIAVALGHCDAVKQLLASGADPDTCVGKHGEVPLQIAVQLWFMSVQEAGVRHGLGVLGFGPQRLPPCDESCGEVVPSTEFGAAQDEGDARQGDLTIDAASVQRDSLEGSEDSLQLAAWTPEPRHVFRQTLKGSRTDGSAELSTAARAVAFDAAFQNPLHSISGIDGPMICGTSVLMEDEACSGGERGWRLRRTFCGLLRGRKGALPEMGSSLTASSESAMASKLRTKRRVKTMHAPVSCLSTCWGGKGSKAAFGSPQSVFC
jgi:hypothetical protein